jgi:hypothetical protein
MAIRRTFLVKMPSSTLSPYMDILVEGPVGDADEPVRHAAGGTTPPTGWQPFTGDDGQFYEIRGRTLRFETVDGDDGFVPRARLGWQLAVTCMDGDSDGCNIPPVARMSRSFVGTPPVAAFQPMTFDDPDYGAVIRLLNSPDTEGALYMLTLTFPEPKDESKSPTAGGG